MVVQASAGQRLAAHDPEATAETLSVIADAARQAEQDMGRLVALLGDERAIAPAPDLAPELVACCAELRELRGKLARPMRYVVLCLLSALGRRLCGGSRCL